MTHVVNSLQFEVTCPDEDMSFNLRQNFGQTLQQEIAEIIDEVCSENVGEDELIKIDRIELDLGAFSRHTFGTDFKKVFRQKLRNELVEKLSDIMPVERQASRLVSNTEALLYFLANGTLPWFADETAISIDEILQQAAADQQGVLSDFFNRNRFDGQIWRRILWQLDNKSKQLVINLSADLKSVAEIIANRLVEIAEIITDLKILMDQPASPEYQEVLSVINDVIIENAGKIFSAGEKTGIAETLLGANIEQILGTDKALVRQVELEFANAAGTAAAAALVNGTKLRDEHRAESEEAFTESSVEENIEKYLVKHSGLVLLTPFFNSFFSELNLLDGAAWKNNDCAFKAVHLLKFLSTGQQRVPEYALVLEKILCGLPVNVPVPLDVVLEPKDIEEAQSLLKAMIAHWNVLKNTSIDGLRETFIRRDGLVTKRDNGWLLQVERKTLDVLLDQIPWGYSTVSLPWNDYLIFVEW